MIAGHVNVPTVIAAIIEGSGQDVQTWIAGLTEQIVEDDNATGVEFVPEAELRKRSLDSTLTGSEHGLGRIVCTVDSEAPNTMQASMGGGVFRLASDVQLHGPLRGGHLKPSETGHHGVVLVTGIALPDTVMTASAGLPVSRIVRHPALDGEQIECIDRIDGDPEPLTRIWLKPSYRQVPMPTRMREGIIDNRKQGERP